MSASAFRREGRPLKDDRPFVDVRDLSVRFHGRGCRQVVQAVDSVSFAIHRGKTLGLVGESGCGKSTIARAIVRLLPPSGGRIWYDGEDLAELNKNQILKFRRRIQLIFQDSAASLNPIRKVGESIAEPLRVQGINRHKRTHRAREMMHRVGLDSELYFESRPHELSGGQCQRVQIARSLITNPDLLVCDEPVSALDVCVQAQILNLLESIKRRYHLTLLFISHDLAAVKHVSDHVAVMYLGALCEVAPAETLFHFPKHPYTAVLLSSIPSIRQSMIQNPLKMKPGESFLSAISPHGCRFHTRCPYARSRCRSFAPSMTQIGHDHQVACHFPMDNFEFVAKSH